MCDYQGYEFGGSYPDSICIDGRLFDADDCDCNGNVYEPAEHIPCPMCHEGKAITYWKNRFECGGESPEEAQKSARSLVADIRSNRTNGTEPWKQQTAARQTTHRYQATCGVSSEAPRVGPVEAEGSGRQ